MKRRFPVLLCLGSLALAGCGGDPVPNPEAETLRTLASGDVIGSKTPVGGHVWRGLPFAAPPVDSLRWRGPRPEADWEGTREALVSGAACPQFASALSGEDRTARGFIGSEDCLYLDVYAPSRAADEALPVMVWIHGGPMVGRAAFYDAGNLAIAHDVVIVVIQFRMGPFGWFHHASMRDEGATAAERSGSFALLDQVRSLEWVRENIGAFGGDPHNVTIFGEGFGAWSVVNLFVSPVARGLFQRAIVQSSPGWSAPNPSQAENWTDDPVPGRASSSNERIADLLIQDGRAADRESAREVLEEMGDGPTAAYLRSKSARDVLAAYVEDPETHSGSYPFTVATHDGVVSPAESALESLTRGEHRAVPIILGTTRDEKKLVQALSPEFVDLRLGTFPYPRDPGLYAAAARHHARLCQAATVVEPASVLRMSGARVFAFRWDWDEEPSLPFLYDGPGLLGAAHGLVGPFVFGQFDIGPQTNLIFGWGSRSGREALSREMMSYWAEFAYNGAPGRGRNGDLAEWTAWPASDPSGVEEAELMIFDSPSDGGSRMASGAVDSEAAIAALLAEPAFTSRRQRCETLFEWGCISRARYESIDACRGIPYEP